LLETDRGSTSSHTVERLRTCRKTDCVVRLSVKTRDVTLAYRGNESVFHMYVSMFGAHMLVHTPIVASKVKLVFVQPETNSQTPLCVHCVRNNCNLRTEYENTFRIYVSRTRKETSGNFGIRSVTFSTQACFYSSRPSPYKAQWLLYVPPDLTLTSKTFCSPVVYPGILFGGVQQIQLKTRGRENGDLGAVAP
jgi:hypothetical protein